MTFVPQRNIPQGITSRPASPGPSSTRRFQPWAERVKQENHSLSPRPRAAGASARLSKSDAHGSVLHRENFSQYQTYHNTQFLSHNPYR